MPPAKAVKQCLNIALTVWYGSTLVYRRVHRYKQLDVGVLTY